MPSPAMILALIALVAAVGGTAYAGVKLKKNSVKTKTIKDKAVTTSKLADGAVTSPKIGDGQVGSADLASSGKSLWMESAIGDGRSIQRQSGGITAQADTGISTATLVNFGQDVSNRAISVSGLLTLGSINVEYARCTDVSCPGAPNSKNAILVIPFVSNTGSAVNTGFSITASP
jgi:hypothetical protein